MKAADFLEPERLRAFAAVAETGSFTRASERLHLTQPAISVQSAAWKNLFGSAMAPKAFQYFLNGVLEPAEMLTRGREHELPAFLFRTKSGNKAAIESEDLGEYMKSYGNPERMVAGFTYYRAVLQNMEVYRKRRNSPRPRTWKLP